MGIENDPRIETRFHRSCPGNRIPWGDAPGSTSNNPFGAKHRLPYLKGWDVLPSTRVDKEMQLCLTSCAFGNGNRLAAYASSDAPEEKPIQLRHRIRGVHWRVPNKPLVTRLCNGYGGPASHFD
jgi:hypothetical protein